MKKLITLQIILFICTLGWGQHVMVTMHKPHDLEVFMKTSKDYQELQKNQNEVKGSPYLAEEFERSLVLLNRTWYKDIALKYDMYNDCFEVKFETGIRVIDPIKNNIDTIKHRGEVFVRIILDPGNTKSVSYLSLLGEWENYRLYKQYKVRLNPATPTDGYNEAKPAEFHGTSPGYYISKNNEFSEINGIKNFAEVYDTEVKTVKRFLKDNGYKLSVEQELVSAAAYFANLSADPK